MNREEILAKSRDEKRDEGMISAENRGRKIGITAFCLIFIFITLFNLFAGRRNDGPQAMFWAFVAAEAFPKYRFTGKKAYMVTTVAGAVASAAALGTFIISAIR